MVDPEINVGGSSSSSSSSSLSSSSSYSSSSSSSNAHDAADSIDYEEFRIFEGAGNLYDINDNDIHGQDNTVTILMITIQFLMKRFLFK